MTVRPVLLVTGASGFIGRGLLRQISLSNEFRYRVVLLSSHSTRGFESVDDMRDESGLYRFTARAFEKAGIERVDAVIHLGAFTPKSGAEANDANGSVANILNTRHLLDQLPSRPERLVFASSLDVYAPAAGPLHESNCCEPASLYGQSKLFCERLLQVAAPSGTIVQVLRIGHTYGPGEEAYRKFIPETIRRLLRGQPPQLTTAGEEKRAFIHIDDCCRMILAALRLEERAGPINIASSEARSLLEVAAMLCRTNEEFQGQPQIPHVCPDAPPGRDVVPDNTKMQRLLGRETVTLADGLRQEFAQMRSGAE